VPARKAGEDAIAIASQEGISEDDPALVEAEALLDKLTDELVPSAKKAYEDAKARAERECDEALDAASKVYKEAKTRAEKAYQEAGLWGTRHR
jgi:vacuolar-type H+-ATPase subunit H